MTATRKRAGSVFGIEVADDRVWKATPLRGSVSDRVGALRQPKKQKAKPVARKRAKRRVMDASKFIAVRELDADRPERGWYAAVNGYVLPARANQKLHWKHVQSQRQLGQRIARTLSAFPLPCTITLTRVSPGKLDTHDGLGMAFKAIVDGIADVLVGKAVTITRNGRKVTVVRGDDSDPRLTWQYRQERGEYAIKAEVTRA